MTETELDPVLKAIILKRLEGRWLRKNMLRMERWSRLGAELEPTLDPEAIRRAADWLATREP